jgi:hypothetical protein
MKKISFEKAYQEFASTFTSTQSYFGTDAAPYVLAAFTNNKLADLAGQLVQDINESEPIAKLGVSDLVQFGDNCDFTPSGTLTTSDVLLTPKKVWADFELCYDDLRGVYNGLANASETGIEPSQIFMNALQEVFLSEMNKNVMNRALYATGGTGTTVYDGITGIWEQITTNVVTGSSAISASNIIQAVEDTILELDNDVLENEMDGVIVLMNQKMLRYYQSALAASGAAWGYNPADGKPRTYDGFRIETLSKMADNNIIVVNTNNIALGVGNMGEFEQFTMVDFRRTTLDKKFGMSIAGRFDIKVILESQASKWYKV